MNNLNPYTLTKEQYQELYKEVLLFAQVGGVTNDVDSIWKMCEEEFCNELMPAIEAEDRIEIIDGVCDSWVTIVQLHNFYMSKPTWELPVPEATYLGDFYELEYMIGNRYSSLVHNSMRKLLFVSEALSEEYKFNLCKAIKEVNRSNMTKFPPLQEVLNKYGDKNMSLRASLDCEELSSGKYKDVVAEVRHPFDDRGFPFGPLVVFRADHGNGKICKPAWAFQEPNFDHCWL